MSTVQTYRTAALPAELACQIKSYFRLLLLNDTVGERRFFDPFVDADMQHFVIVERGDADQPRRCFAARDHA